MYYVNLNSYFVNRTINEPVLFSGRWACYECI